MLPQHVTMYPPNAGGRVGNPFVPYDGFRDVVNSVGGLGLVCAADEKGNRGTGELPENSREELQADIACPAGDEKVFGHQRKRPAAREYG